jgi:hypothetical protein
MIMVLKPQCFLLLLLLTSFILLLQTILKSSDEDVLKLKREEISSSGYSLSKILLLES